MAHKHAFATDESRWKAVVARDPAAEGKFFYAVKTTGVFCRPGCSSRRPNRNNVAFFNMQADAERAGYRPCKRCQPGAASLRARQADIIAGACHRLEQAEAAPTLAELAAATGLSPWHFHRLFKQIVGVTPKKYAATHRLQRFRGRLKANHSVAAAVYDAGFGSSSRAYENTGGRLGMTPSAYRKGAVGLTIRYTLARCFLGWIVVAITERGICAIEFGDDPKALRAQLQDHFPKATLEQADADFSTLVNAVTAFIETPAKGLDLPLDIQGTAFQQRVWHALREIPLGVTASYAEIARRIGKPGAVRAVARACAANKLAVVIPCHRVVRGNGALSGYRWGVERKRALLQREAGNPRKRAPHEQRMQTKRK